MEAFYKTHIEPLSLCQITVFLSFAIHMATVLVLSSIPFVFQFVPSLNRFKIQPTKHNPISEQLKVCLAVLAAQIFFQAPLIFGNYFFFRYFGLPVDYDSIPGWFDLTCRIYVSFVFDDTWHYWAHRALHSTTLYRFHKLHHTYTAPMSIQAEYTHPLETLLTGIGFFIPAFLLCNHIVFLWLWMFLRVAELIDVHSGYDFGFSIFHLMPGYAGPRFHDFHHQNFTGNYAPTFVWWDWICGTDDEYHQFLAEKKE
eukprot:gnl/Spiro4/24700_TR12263_c0_g1_i1.p1 gnl/Spiro4/24700_TR12263_c0_g1~~gnl/Spiro4/24700_TR12263_c0_g1_i1.p1  ORF type:complete len:263 (+),score=50.50 gnl/Spiro4/24700_TR12263_c0_g1_i1:25-789(+)